MHPSKYLSSLIIDFKSNCCSIELVAIIIIDDCSYCQNECAAVSQVIKPA